MASTSAEAPSAAQDPLPSPHPSSVSPGLMPAGGPPVGATSHSHSHILGPGPDPASAPGLGPAATNVSVNPNLIDISQLKLTRGHSCVLCQQRKVRCGKTKPCANCVKANVECRVVAPLPPRRKKRKPHERDLLDRLRRYEDLLAQNGVAFDPIAHDLRPSDNLNIVSDPADDSDLHFGGPKTSSSQHSGSQYDSREANDPDRKPVNQTRENHDDLQECSSDDENEGTTLHQAFDKMFENQDSFPFVIGAGNMSPVLTDKHPRGIQVMQLWQMYLDNINPLLKMTHAQSLQGQIIEAGTNPERISKPLEALMFSIYLVAVTSVIDDDSIQTIFGEEKTRLASKYQTATQQALINAGFMRSSDLMVLQAYVLYLFSVRQFVDPRSLYCLLGIAVRIAERLGLHRDGAQFNFPPFEVEMRRRLWWVIVIFDKRFAQITGSTITALSSSNGDCRWPLNINDTDLHIHAKETPPSYNTPTEMIFMLCRIELTTASPTGIGPAYLPPATSPESTHSSGSQRPVFKFSQSPAVPDVTSTAASMNLPAHDLDHYCRLVEDIYLQQCDRKVPLHLFTLLFTQQALCLLRIIAYLCRAAAGDEGNMAERDAMFAMAIRIVDLDNRIYSERELKGFIWYTKMYFPLPGYMFLAHELRARRTGHMVERAWEAIVENHHRRGLMRIRSPVHFALGQLFVKAWDGRQAAEARLGRFVSTPRFVEAIRQELGIPPAKPDGRPAQTSASRPSASPENFPHYNQQQHHQQQQTPHTPHPQNQNQLSPGQLYQQPHQNTPHQQHTPAATPIRSDNGAGGHPMMMAEESPGVFGGFNEQDNQYYDNQTDPALGDYMQMDWISMMPEISNMIMNGGGVGGGMNPMMGMGPMSSGFGMQFHVSPPGATSPQPHQQHREQQPQQQQHHHQQVPPMPTPVQHQQPHLSLPPPYQQQQQQYQMRVPPHPSQHGLRGAPGS